MNKLLIAFIAAVSLTGSINIHAMENQKPANFSEKITMLTRELREKQQKLQKATKAKEDEQKLIEKIKALFAINSKTSQNSEKLKPEEENKKKALKDPETRKKTHEDTQRQLQAEIAQLNVEIEEANRLYQATRNPVVRFFSKYRAGFAGISPAVIATIIAYMARKTAAKYADKPQPHENSFDAHLIVLDAWLKKNKFKSLTGVAVCCIAAAAGADVLGAGAHIDDRSHIVDYFSGGNT